MDRILVPYTASSLQQYTADHRYLMAVVAREAGFVEPVAIDLGDFYQALTQAAIKGKLLPFDGVLIRQWEADKPRRFGFQLGLRFYEIQGIRFVRVCFPFDNGKNHQAFNCTVVDRKDYRRLFQIALRCYRELEEEPSPPPVLPPEQADVLWQNTVGYLDTSNLNRIRRYGGRPRRGVLLMGPPGNGKTMACRWIMDACKRRGWEWTLVSADDYRQARSNNSVNDLFDVSSRGVIFFDDMDIALRDRETVHETEDQTVFLSALDGIEVKEGLVFVFTSNCDLALIDRAFKRPGRIDVALQFRAPDAAGRRQLVERWHEDIRRHVNVEAVVASTDGYSFAEIEELKNLLILRYTDTEGWDWGWALRQFDVNRKDLSKRDHPRVGFLVPTVNGH